jgi:type II secretory pathway pseudopilin PulG
MKGKQKGFSLIELLILIIAAIAIPNLLRSRMAANEASAVGSLRTINTAAVTYSTTYGIGYDRGGDYKSGYSFTYTQGSVTAGITNGYTLVAVPVAAGSTGQRTFFTDQSGVIRADATGTTANANSTPIS